MKNSVFIATSLDGFIAGQNDELAWLSTFPEIDHIDTGFNEFTSRMDAILMGRNTFKVVWDFEGEWFYKKPVFVWSNTLSEIPEKFRGKLFWSKEVFKKYLQRFMEKAFKTFTSMEERPFKLSSKKT